MGLNRNFTTPEQEKDCYLEASHERCELTNRCLRQYAAASGRTDLKVLEVGRTPDDRMVRSITSFIAPEVAVVEAPPALWPGQEYDRDPRRETLKLDGRDITFATQHVNMEKDKLPFADSSFDIVLFCEVLEHLLHDPVLALSEIGRVLAGDGLLVLSTPNALCWVFLLVLAANRNHADMYSGYGPYGRHAREYSRREIEQLLTAMGFGDLEFFRSFDPPQTSSVLKKAVFKAGDLITKLPVPFLREKNGNTILCLARKKGDISAVYPRWLFRSRF